MAHVTLTNGLTQPPHQLTPSTPDKHILILNLMPNRAVTERQFTRMLEDAETDATIQLTFCLPATHAIRRHAEAIHTAYTDFATIRDQSFDALIVTGAPLDRIAFADVDYWDEFREILAWRHDHIKESLFLCWGADAAGFADGVFTPTQLTQKITGIYQAGPVIMPQSRYFTIPCDSLTRGTIVAGTPELGALIVRDDDARSTYVSGHFEYFTGTLADEYHRDRHRNGDAAPRPEHYFDANMQVHNTWHSSAVAFYTDWLSKLS